MIAYLFLALSFFWQTESTNLENNVGSLRGVVYQEGTELCLPNVTVKLVELGLTAETDVDGYYSFEEVISGIYTLSFFKKGFLPEIKNDIEVAAGKFISINAWLEEGLSADSMFQQLLTDVTNKVEARELRLDIRNLGLSWSVLPERLLEVMILPQPENNSLIKSAILISGELGVTSKNILSRLANFLDSPNFLAEAQHSLSLICGREFADSKSFYDWYKIAKQYSRENWLENVLREQWRQEEALWKEKLASKPSVDVISLALNHRRKAVRKLANEALAVIAFDQMSDSQKNTLRESFRASLQSENNFELKLQLLPLVPVILRDREAASFLIRVVEQAEHDAALIAARQLSFVKPSEQAWGATLRCLNLCYQENVEADRFSPSIRLALWTGLGSLLDMPDSVRRADVDLISQKGLGLETDFVVLQKIYFVIGQHASMDFLPFLKAILFDEDKDSTVRSLSLTAMSKMSIRLPSASAKIKPLLPELLSDSSVQIRSQAIQAVQSNLPTKQALILFAERLVEESEVPLQKLLLTSLSEQQNSSVYAQLLSFSPSEELVEEYCRALQVHIGQDIKLLDKAIVTLDDRGSYKMAFLIVSNFSVQSSDLDGLEELNSLYAGSLSKYVLDVGIAANTSVMCDDALLRLAELRTKSPLKPEWSSYAIRLHMLRGETIEAAGIVSTLLASNTSSYEKWSISLDVIEKASQEGLVDITSNLYEKLIALGEVPQDLRLRFSSLMK